MVSERKGVFGRDAGSVDFWIIIAIVFGIYGGLIGALVNIDDREFSKTLIKIGIIVTWINYWF